MMQVQFLSVKSAGDLHRNDLLHQHMLLVPAQEEHARGAHIPDSKHGYPHELDANAMVYYDMASKNQLSLSYLLVTNELVLVVESGNWSHVQHEGTSKLIIHHVDGVVL